MGKRGIYCQLNYFCTWARDAQNYYDQNTNGSGQLMNAWKHLNKPMILNEPCQMNNRGDHWQDKIMRDATYASDYRDYFWMMFVNGGSGCYHASWYNKNVPPNDAALKVIDVQKYLRSFMAALPVRIMR